MAMKRTSIGGISLEGVRADRARRPDTTLHSRICWQVRFLTFSSRASLYFEAASRRLDLNRSLDNSSFLGRTDGQPIESSQLGYVDELVVVVFPLIVSNAAVGQAMSPAPFFQRRTR